MKKTKLTGDRIATLGSRMMKFQPGMSADARIYVDIGNVEFDFRYTGLTVGEIRDAGASLVSQSDGPEPVALKQKKIALKQSRKRKAGR